MPARRTEFCPEGIRIARGCVLALLLVSLFGPWGPGPGCGADGPVMSGLVALVLAFLFIGVLAFPLAAAAVSFVGVTIRPGSPGWARFHRWALCVVAVGVLAAIRIGGSGGLRPTAETWGGRLFVPVLLLAAVVEVRAFLLRKREPAAPAPAPAPPAGLPLWAKWVAVTTLGAAAGIAAGSALGLFRTPDLPRSSPAVGNPAADLGIPDSEAVRWRTSTHSGFGRGFVVDRHRGGIELFGAIGAVVGLLQWLLVRRRLGYAWVWLLLGPIAVWQLVGVRDVSPLAGAGLVGAALAAAVGRLVSPRLFRFGLALVASPLAVAAGAAVALEVPVADLAAAHGLLAAFLLWGAALGVATGAISGAALVALLRAKARRRFRALRDR